MITISLLHATYRSGQAAVRIREQWLLRACRPDLIEHIFALDTDDKISVSATSAFQRVLGPPSAQVTAVRNWNLAAEAARGDLLVVIADDLVPKSHGWDDQLRSIGFMIDPLSRSYAIKVRDSPDPKDTLMRHPVVSRRFFEVHGLFHDEFTGVFCDDDVTLTAFWKSTIVDGRHIVLDHVHPSLDPTVRESESQKRINSEDEYDRGRAVLARRWPVWLRRCNVRLLVVRDRCRRLSGVELTIASVAQRQWSLIAGVPRWWTVRVIRRCQRLVERLS